MLSKQISNRILILNFNGLKTGWENLDFNYTKLICNTSVIAMLNYIGSA